MLNEMEKQDLYISYLRIATIQFPFLPVFVRPNFNSLSEPEGSINYWILGKKKIDVWYPGYEKKRNEIPALSLILNDLETELLDTFESNYLEWFDFTIKGILEYITIKENPDIILFPEYSLPIEISNKINDTLIKYSKNRCIVGGIGSVSLDGSQIRNKFILYNNGTPFPPGEKVVRSPFDPLDIEEGKGPLLYPITLYPNGKKIEILALVAMCSDYINLKGSPSKVNTVLYEELNNNKNYKSFENIIILVPALSTNTQDLQPLIFNTKTRRTSKLGHIDSIRMWRNVAIANCSFFGDSCIYFCPLEFEGLNNEVSSFIKKGESGCVVTDIPYPPCQNIQPKPKHMLGKNRILRKPKFKNRIYPIFFKDEIESDEHNSIFLDAKGFWEMINARLNKSMIYSAINFLNDSNILEDNDKILAIKTWKDLQNEITCKTSERSTLYKELPSLLTPYLDRIIFADDPYNVILNILRKIVENDEHQKCIDDIKVSVLGNLPTTDFQN